jgi:hypothetical protein
MSIPYILKTSSLALFPAAQPPITLLDSHPNFTVVVEAIRAGDFDKALELASIPAFISNITDGRVTVDGNGVRFGNEPVTGYLAEKMVRFFNDGLPVVAYCKFLENLYNNPSRTALNELFLFLEAADLPVTDDGYFIAYKAIRNDWRDCHSGRFDNSPGTTHVMPRNQVDDNRDRTCSYGFHAAAYQYARNFMPDDGRLVAVKINPADVVSVPSDYDNQKLRTCSYTVLYEIPGALDTLTRTNYHAATPPAESRATTFYDDMFDDDADAWEAGFEEGYRVGLSDANG